MKIIVLSAVTTETNYESNQLEKDREIKFQENLTSN